MTTKRTKAPPLETLFQELAALADEPSRRKFIRGHRRLLRLETVEQLCDQARQQLRVDAKQALRLAESASTIAESIQNPRAEALACRAKANALWFLNENEQAVQLYARACRVFEQLGDQTELGRTLSSSIQPLILLGKYDRALQAAERARAIFTREGDQQRLARLSINFANIYSRQDRLREALGMYEQAYQDLLPSGDVEAIGVVLHNMAVTLILLNDFATALATYEKARAFCEQHGMSALVAQADYNVAYLYYLRGEYSRALDLLRATRNSCRKAGDSYHAALCNLDQSDIYLELNLLEEAAEMAQEAFGEFEKMGMGYEAAKVLTNRAVAVSRQGNPFGALEIFAQAREQFSREGNRVWTALVDLYQAVVLYEQGRLFEARRLCTAARDQFQASGLASKEILCRVLVGRICLRTGEIEAAGRECQAALGRLENLDSPQLAYQARLLMGQLQEAQGSYERAYQSYESAREALETLRSILRGDELKISFLKNRLEVYENLVRLCLARNGPAAAEEALLQMERAKSRSLRELLFERARPNPAPDAGQSELVRQIRNLREELNWYYHRIELEQLRPETGSSERLERLQQQLRAREKQFLDVLREMPTAEAEVAGLHRAPALTLQEIRSALGPQRTLVEYFRTGEQILAVVLTANGVQMVPLTLVSRIKNLLRSLQFQLSKFRLGPEYFSAFQEALLNATQGHLRELYQELIEPIRNQFEGDHLVLVPHDILHYLPLHALFDGTRYLMDAFTVSYAPSASVYALCDEKAVNRAGPSLVLGVPDPELPYILTEVQAVNGLLPQAELFLGTHAGESVLREKGPQSRFIHIATHGRFREDNPMFSGVRLGDSYLTLYDLYQLRLPAELVTLSGCATGLSVVAGGDELLGLVRGLLTAGAETLLLTLWEVHDQSTAEFMQAFYSRYLAGHNKATALQGAMKDLRERHPHPYFWAPFVLLGKP